jgi:hypothetical protein
VAYSSSSSSSKFIGASAATDIRAFSCLIRITVFEMNYSKILKIFYYFFCQANRKVLRSLVQIKLIKFPL